MSALLPPQRPLQSRAQSTVLLAAHGIAEPVALLGVRGYFLDSLGAAGANDRGLYDDALIIVSPAVHAAFNGSTDPSVFRAGIASLALGVWRYQAGIHGLSRPAAQRYPAFVQAAPVLVRRDARPSESGWFGINIHRGGARSTSSLGCQTVPPAQWESFRALLLGELARHGQKTFPYLLVEDARLAGRTA